VLIVHVLTTMDVNSVSMPETGIFCGTCGHSMGVHRTFKPADYFEPTRRRCLTCEKVAPLPMIRSRNRSKWNAAMPVESASVSARPSLGSRKTRRDLGLSGDARYAAESSTTWSNRRNIWSPWLGNRRRLVGVVMWTRSVFWAALAIAFLALAVVAWRERKHDSTREFPLGDMTEYFIVSPVARALKNILRVEFVGFLLAAAAAIYQP